MLNWILADWVEVLGALTGIIYLFFSVRRIIWLWPFGILTSILYVTVFLEAKFYAGMSLQFYYLVVSVYGWIHWKKAEKTGNDKAIKVGFMHAGQRILAVLVVVLLTVLTAGIMKRFTDNPVPWIDAFTTSGSIVATWLLARKAIENWILWLVIDSVSIALYLYKGLYPTAFLFLVYTIMAITGYYQWRKAIPVNH